MKKLILVIISALIMTVFIAFNYLLWDREKIVGMDADKMASIDALSKQIRNLNDENSLIRQKSKDQDETIQSMQEKINQTAMERSLYKDKSESQGYAIRYLKQSANLKPLEEVIRKWVEGINNGQYEAAYRLQSKQYMKQDINGFTNTYKTSVRNMSLKSLTLAVDGIPDERKNEIIFKAVLEVKKNDSSNKLSLNDGNNVRFFAIGWNQYSDEWVINDIFATQ